MNPPFVHLHAHSWYSFLDGVPAPAALAARAAEAGMPALALTDHHGLTGAIEFYDACRAAGVQPILGLELAAQPPLDLAGPVEAGSLILLAMDMQGWRALCRLSSLLLGEEGRDPERGLPFEALAEAARGLLCLTGGKRGYLGRALLAGQVEAAEAFAGRLADLFPGRLYVELQRQSPDDDALSVRLADLAHRLRLPVVAANNVHYLKPEEARLQRTLAAMRRNTPLDRLPPDAPAPAGSHFATGEEMRARFAETPAALAATLEIAARCRLELPLGAQHYPAVELPPGQSAEGVLREKAEAGLRRLYGARAEALGERLDHELQVITGRGYAPLFLIMEEIVRYARETGVPIASRGSASSSLAAHCLGITTPEPVALNLYFERFLNPARATPPDIDLDLCSRRRDGVIRHVYERWGAERVAMVCTINRFRARSALREAAKAHGIASAQIKAMADALPQRWWGPPSDAASQVQPYADLLARYNAPRHRALFRDATLLLGAPHHLSLHPGGVVIAPGPLHDLAPTALASKGVAITQFDLESVERLGLVKIDLLGIRGLTVLGDVAEAAQEAAPRRYPRPLDVLDAVPPDDPATVALVSAGRTIGCFQIESPGMRATLKEVRARSADDLMVALALYRPGPLTGGLKDAFVRRHLGREAAEHLHPALEPLLRETHGVILYQEQVLRIAHELAGLTLADADLLRRAMSHFDPGKQMQTLKENFVRGAGARAGVPPETAGRVWALMAAFAGYGFPKAHAASYAQVAWRAAWCKAHFPAEFMASVLANWGGYYPQRVYLTEARRMGLALRPPHVNHSARQFSPVRAGGETALYAGLDQVRDLTRRTQERILRGRPFGSLADFLARADPRPQEAESLVRCGALAGLGSIPSLLRQLGGGAQPVAQLALFDLPLPGDDLEEWPLEERVAAEEAILGVGVSAHPLELRAQAVAAAGALTTVDAAGRLGQKVRVAGVRLTWRRTVNERGEPLYRMSLEDLEGLLEVLIEADVYRRDRAALRGEWPVVVEGVVELDGEAGEVVVRGERVWRVGESTKDKKGHEEGGAWA